MLQSKIFFRRFFEKNNNFKNLRRKKMKKVIEILVVILVIVGCDKKVYLPESIQVHEDYDNDGVPDSLDNCPLVANTNQADSDHDGVGDVCDPDDLDRDGDGYSTREGDCDDGDAKIHPKADEVCDDGDDNDCDGHVDCGDQDCEKSPKCTTPTDAGTDADVGEITDAADATDATEDVPADVPGDDAPADVPADDGGSIVPTGNWHLTGYDCTGGDGEKGDWDDEVCSSCWVYAWFATVDIGMCYISHINEIFGVDDKSSSIFPVEVKRVECPKDHVVSSPANCTGPGFVLIGPK
jgi:hypothetical protein